jgi:hypothetical protein
VKSELPDAASLYEAALERLINSHESEAAECLARCGLEIVPTGGVYLLCVELQPVRLILTGPGDAVSRFEQSPEIKGRVRQALDYVLGPTVHITQIVVLARTSSQAA